MATAITSPPATGSDCVLVSRYRTVADLLEHLGGVPASRVRFQPWPGTATVHDVIAIHDAENRLCELVDGVLVEKVMGFDESIYAVLLSAFVVEYLKAHDLGKVIGADGLMRIFPDMVRIPDVAFVSWPATPKVSGGEEKFPSSSPTLSSRCSQRETLPRKRRASSMNTSVPQFGWFGTSIPSGEPFASIPGVITLYFSTKTEHSTAAMFCPAFHCRSANGSPKRAAPRPAESCSASYASQPAPLLDAEKLRKSAASSPAVIYRSAGSGAIAFIQIASSSTGICGLIARGD